MSLSSRGLLVKPRLYFRHLSSYNTVLANHSKFATTRRAFTKCGNYAFKQFSTSSMSAFPVNTVANVDADTAEFLQAIGQPASILGSPGSKPKLPWSSDVSKNLTDEDDIPGEVMHADQADNFETLAEVQSMVDPSAWFQKFLEYAHYDVGLSWGTAILVCGLVIRAAAFGAHVKAERHFTLHNLHTPELMKMKEDLKAARESGDKEKIRKANYKFNNYSAENGLPTVGQYIVNATIQLAAVGAQVIAIDRMACANAGNMLESTFAWIPHLALPDPTHVLPMISACCIFTYLVHINVRTLEFKTKIDQLMRLAIYMLALLSSILLYQYLKSLSAATNLSLALNVTLTLGVTLAFRTRPLRSLFKLAPIRQFSTTSYKNSEGRRLFTPNNVDYGKKSEESKTRLRASLINLKGLITNPKEFVAKHEHSRKGLMPARVEEKPTDKAS